MNMWDGELTDGSPRVNPQLMSSIRTNLAREILPHADAYMVADEAARKLREFVTPPRPHKEPAAEVSLPELPPFPFPLGERGEDKDAFEAAKMALQEHGGEVDEDVVHTVASAFDIDPSQLKAAVSLQTVPSQLTEPRNAVSVRGPPGLTPPGHPQL